MPELNIHAANPEEQKEAFRNFHDVWGAGLDVEQHIRTRSTSPKYQNARWYVACLDDRVVSGCGCYAFALKIDGEVLPACAFGEVHTLAEFRGRGFAPRLIEFVESEQRKAGKAISLLYSDIKPRYYERLGYTLCASPEAWSTPPGGNRASAPSRLVPIDPRKDRAEMAALYDEYHKDFSFSVARSPEYWDYLLARVPTDSFFALADAAGKRVGYLRGALGTKELKIRDFALASHDGGLLRSLLEAALALGQERNVGRVGGWLPKVGADSFEWKQRLRELPMLKPLIAGLAIRQSHQDAGEHLHEIDHV